MKRMLSLLTLVFAVGLSTVAMDAEAAKRMGGPANPWVPNARPRRTRRLPQPRPPQPRHLPPVLPLQRPRARGWARWPDSPLAWVSPHLASHSGLWR
jgi:hypothetical protein